MYFYVNDTVKAKISNTQVSSRLEFYFIYVYTVSLLGRKMVKKGLWWSGLICYLLGPLLSK